MSGSRLGRDAATGSDHPPAHDGFTEGKSVADDAQSVWGACFIKLVVYDDNPKARAFYDRLGFAGSTGETTLTLDKQGLATLKDK